MAWRSFCKTQFKKLKKMSNSIVEIRDYTIEADWFEA
jgi:hypothetical protein